MFLTFSCRKKPQNLFVQQTGCTTALTLLAAFPLFFLLSTRLHMLTVVLHFCHYEVTGEHRMHIL